jgi:hypothetical protein
MEENGVLTTEDVVLATGLVQYFQMSLLTEEAVTKLKSRPETLYRINHPISTTQQAVPGCTRSYSSLPC